MMSENPILATPINDDGSSRASYTAFEDASPPPASMPAPTRQEPDNIFTEEDWEKVHLLEDYVPLINGALKKEYVDLRVKMQTDLGADVSTKNTDGQQVRLKDIQPGFVHVPVDVARARADRIMESEKACLEKVRENKYYIADQTCDEIITKHGEEILCKINCVAILNAPQTGRDHHGDCRLFLTRTVRNDIPYYRIYFYAYGEAAKYDGEESTEVVHRQWVEIFRNMICLSVRTKYGLKADYSHTVRRDVLAEFISIAVEDVLGIHHRLADYLQMRRLSKYESVREEHAKYLDASCCNDLCSCCACGGPSCCCAPCCPFSYDKLWKWTMHEERRIDLAAMVCREEKTVEHQPEVLLYDPVKQHNVPMAVDTECRTSSRRYHTLNLTCIDSFERHRKYRCAIVLHPDAPTNGAMDFMCQVNRLLDEVRTRKYAAFGSEKDGELAYHRWVAHMPVDGRKPFEEHTNMFAQVRQFVNDLISARLNIYIPISWPYFYNYVPLIFFAFFGMVVCFAVSSSGGIFGVMGAFSLVHGAYRVYTLRETMYVQTALYVDIVVVVLGTLLAAIGGSTASVSSAGQAGAVFTLLQALFTFWAATYQVYLYLRHSSGEGIYIV